MNAERLKNRILFADDVSRWLKQALEVNWERDPVDALRDARTLIRDSVS